MITKEQKIKILEKYKNDEERLLLSSIIDKVNKFEKTDKIEYTNFLNLSEYNSVIFLLNELNVKYITFSLDNKLTKKVIFFIPSYITDEKDIFSNYISCIKVIPKLKNKLSHKDYMGAIYNLGIKEEKIGDIFLNEGIAYVFVFKTIEEYILNNLLKVGNQTVDKEGVDFSNDEIQSLSLNLEEKEYIVTSLRIDNVLCSVYNLSRSEVKKKITSGDLFVNDKLECYISRNVNEGDIISFRKCGKLKIGSLVRKTRSERFVIKIFRYV